MGIIKNYNAKTVYGVILWVHDIYHDMLKIFSTFITLPLYFNVNIFSDQFINTHIISNALPYFYDFLIIIPHCFYFFL